MTIQPARHECHACCLLRAEFLAFQPVVDNTRGTRVVQVVSLFQKILRGSQLTWYIYINGLPRKKKSPPPKGGGLQKGSSFGNV